MRKNVKLDPDRFFTIIHEQKERIAELEAKVESLRQVVADVETCRQSRERSTLDSVEICADQESDDGGLCATVCVRSAVTTTPPYHTAPTWQAALHAAAEHIRKTE